MSSLISLDQLKPGDKAILIKLSASPPVLGRLKELGFLPGTRLTCVLQKHRGETSAYDLRGATIALRREDASKILVKPCEKGA